MVPPGRRIGRHGQSRRCFEGVAVPATRRCRQAKTTTALPEIPEIPEIPQAGFAMPYPPSGRCVHAVAAKLGRKDFALSDGWRSRADELNAQLALQHLAGGVARQRIAGMLVHGLCETLPVGLAQL